MSSRSPEAPDYIRFFRIHEFLARRRGRWSEATFGIGPHPLTTVGGQRWRDAIRIIDPAPCVRSLDPLRSLVPPADFDR